MFLRVGGRSDCYALQIWGRAVDDYFAEFQQLGHFLSRDAVLAVCLLMAIVTQKFHAVLYQHYREKHLPCKDNRVL